MPDTGDNYFDAHRFIGRDLHEAVLVKTVYDLVSTSSILDTILQTYDDDQLFRIALHSDDHWNIVSTYLAKATVQPTHPASMINWFTAHGNTDVDVLDMFVHDFAAGAVSRFFEITTGFKIDRVKKKPSYRISSMFILVHELPHLFPIKIAVHVAEEDEYPQMAAFRQKLTCNFPFMTGYGIVVPYAAFNFGGDALINHQYVPLNTNADNRKFKPKWAAPTIMASKSETITSTMTLVELPTFRVPHKSILLQTKRVLLPRSTKNAGPIQQTPIGPVLRIRYYDYSDRSVDFRVPLLQDT
ncbi:hypothetical protein B0H11DRAFT_1919067 [Mycena galericulata]|nr:hypothetical protein B0H11DRAFT_1919067 [Mycena galericulata]